MAPRSRGRNPLVHRFFDLPHPGSELKFGFGVSADERTKKQLHFFDFLNRSQLVCMDHNSLGQVGINNRNLQRGNHAQIQGYGQAWQHHVNHQEFLFRIV